MLWLLKQVLIVGVVFHLLVNVFPSLAEYGGMVYSLHTGCVKMLLLVPLY